MSRAAGRLLCQRRAGAPPGHWGLFPRGRELALRSASARTGRTPTPIPNVGENTKVRQVSCNYSLGGPADVLVKEQLCMALITVGSEPALRVPQGISPSHPLACTPHQEGSCRGQLRTRSSPCAVRPPVAPHSDADRTLRTQACGHALSMGTSASLIEIYSF